MTEWGPPQRPRSHRAPTGARGAGRRLLAPLTAVVVVVVVILLLIWINGRGGGSQHDVAGAPPHPSTPATAPPATPTPRSTPRPSSTPSATHRHRASPPHHHHAAHPSSPPAEVALPPVEVLNNSRISGLAHHVAAEVASRGWTISQVGNLRGRVPLTTLYYPADGYAAAEQLAHEFGSIQRIEPQADGGLSSASLVLVVTRYWSD